MDKHAAILVVSSIVGITVGIITMCYAWAAIVAALSAVLSGWLLYLAAIAACSAVGGVASNVGTLAMFGASYAVVGITDFVGSAMARRRLNKAGFDSSFSYVNR